MVGLRDHEIFEVAEASLHAQLRKPTRPTVEPTEPAEILLLAQVNRLMEWERIYRYEGLTIGSLAARLQVQEYQLRRLINRRLGHKNFNT